jgi:hypothetical protein
VGERQVLVSSRERGNAWLVDTEKKTRRPRITAHQPGQAMPIAHAPGRTVLGYGMWLAVQDPEANEIAYLGYRSFVAQGGAVSPSGQHMAWSIGGEIVVESADQSREPLRMRPETPFGTQFVAFLDEEHVVAAGTDGALRLYHWGSGELVDEMSLGTGLQAAYFDLAHGMILIHRMFGDAAVVELGEDSKFRGPYLIADGAFQMGIRRPFGGEPVGVWTVDSTQKLRTYTLAELRKDLPHDEATDRGETLTVPGGGRVLSVDPRGGQYLLVQEGASATLQRRHGEEAPVKVSVGAHRVSSLLVSPVADLVIAVADSGTLLAFDAETLAMRWSYATTEMQGSPSFSPDGRQVILTSSSGAAILDARSGEIALRRCGTEFGRHGAAPFDAFAFTEAPSFCE